jgi:hypothetical protein
MEGYAAGASASAVSIPEWQVVQAIAFGPVT